MRLRVLLVSFAAAILSAEGLLRLQQHFFRLVDLELVSPPIENVSDTLNHYLYNDVGEGLPRYPVTLVSPKGVTRLGVMDVGRKSAATRVLFLGDSFMQGLSPSETIPNFIAATWVDLQAVKGEWEFINAGVSSYAPSIFIPQFKWLNEALQPDYVVVDIDETDLGDDAIRYAELVERDTKGRIVAVRRSQVLNWYLGRITKLRAHPTYLGKLFLRTYLARVELPREVARQASQQRHLVLEAQYATRGEEGKYILSFEIFRRNLHELVDTLKSEMGAREKIVFFYHPHRQSLEGRDGATWFPHVRRIVKEVSDGKKLSFFDATPEMLLHARALGVEALMIPNDIHYNSVGLELLSKSYARFLAASLGHMHYG